MIRKPVVRHIVSLLLVAVFLSGGIYGFQKLKSLKKPPQSRVPRDHLLNVEVFRIGEQDVQQTIRGFGTVQADREVTISAEVPGKVQRLHHDFEVGLSVVAARYPGGGEGQDAADSPAEPLAAGDVLLVIDKAQYQGQFDQIGSQIRELDPEIARLKAEEQKAKAVQQLADHDFEVIEDELARQTKLYERGVISKAELDRVKLEHKQYARNKTLADYEVTLATQQLKQTRQKIKTLEIQQALLRDDLERTEVKPPFDGYLSEIFVERGQYLRPGDPIARITSIGHVEIPVSLTLADYDKIKPQMDRGVSPAAGLSLHEGEAPKWAGEVTRIAPEANHETRTITVFVEVDNSRQDVPLLPGTFVFARIEGPVYQSEKDFVIPRDAILGNHVFRVEAGAAEKVTVDVVERLQSVAVVNGKLKSGDLLVLTNLDMLKHGLSIQPNEKVQSLDDVLQRYGPWKSYWQIVGGSNSTVQREALSAPRESNSGL